MSLYVTPTLPDELYHHGIKGQKWGRRRFQNEDMTWTAAGKERYGSASDGGHKASSKEKRKTTAKKALKVGLAIAGTALAAYGTYKAVDYAKRRSQALEIGKRVLEQTAKNLTDTSDSRRLDLLNKAREYDRQQLSRMAARPKPRLKQTPSVVRNTLPKSVVDTNRHLDEYTKKMLERNQAMLNDYYKRR